MTNQRFVSKKEARTLCLYSPAHLARLTDAKQFPPRVPLGPGRVGFWLPSVLAWMRCKREGTVWTPDTPDEE